jgi:hypothetical protein
MDQKKTTEKVSRFSLNLASSAQGTSGFGFTLLTALLPHTPRTTQTTPNHK